MKSTCAFVMIAALAGAAQAQQLDLSAEPEDVTLGRKEYSPYLHQGYPQRVFWGDTHLHTSFSTDAGMIGCVLGPEEAYRFARGETVVASSGQRVRLQRPLDFLVVADHAENLGLAPMIADSDPELLRTEFGKEIHGLVKGGDPMGAYALWGRYMAERDDPLKDDDALTRSVWERLTSYAEEYNQPGVFTALIGYARTGSSPSPTTTPPTPRTCGPGWPPTRRRRATACWPSPTTATSPTASCSTR
jgi:hypothetical protein